MTIIMAGKTIRFGINDGIGNRSSTWKCWSLNKPDKFDVYLACRTLGGVFKVSMHQSGRWHIAFLKEFFKKHQREIIQRDGRFIQKWPKPTGIAPGITLAFRIITPRSAVNTPYNQVDFKKISWIPNPRENRAIEIDILITEASAKVSSWPGKNSMKTNLVASMKLDNQNTIWVVYHEIPIPTLAPISKTLKFFKGKSNEDLRSEGIRAIVFKEEPDGSRILFDSIVEHDNNGN